MMGKRGKSECAAGRGRWVRVWGLRVGTGLMQEGGSRAAGAGNERCRNWEIKAFLFFSFPILI